MPALAGTPIVRRFFRLTVLGGLGVLLLTTATSMAVAVYSAQPGNRDYLDTLLEQHHARLDATGTAAHLEATRPRNRRLYVWHGYRPQPVFHLADGGQPLYPMWRR